MQILTQLLTKLLETLQKFVALFSAKFPKLSAFLQKHFKRKNFVITFSALILLFFVISSTLFFIRRPQSLIGIYAGDFTKGPVENVRIYPHNSAAAIRNDKSPHFFTSLKFRTVDPVTVYASVQLKPGQEQLELRFQVINKRDGSIARESILPFNALGVPITEQISERFVSITLNDETLLPKGNYRFVIYSNDGKPIASRSFSVVETVNPKAKKSDET